MGAAVRPGAVLAGGEGVRDGFSQSPERLPASISRRGAEPRQGSIRPVVSRAPERSVSLVGEMEGDGGPGLGWLGGCPPPAAEGILALPGGVTPRGWGSSLLPVVLQARGHPSSSSPPRSGSSWAPAPRPKCTRGPPCLSFPVRQLGFSHLTSPRKKRAGGGRGSAVVLGSAPQVDNVCNAPWAWFGGRMDLGQWDGRQRGRRRRGLPGGCQVM